MTKTDTYAKLTKRKITMTGKDLIDMVEALHPEYAPPVSATYLHDIETYQDDGGKIVIEYTLVEDEAKR